MLKFAENLYPRRPVSFKFKVIFKDFALFLPVANADGSPVDIFFHLLNLLPPGGGFVDSAEANSDSWYHQRFCTSDLNRLHHTLYGFSIQPTFQGR